MKTEGRQVRRVGAPAMSVGRTSPANRNGWKQTGSMALPPPMIGAARWQCRRARFALRPWIACLRVPGGSPHHF